MYLRPHCLITTIMFLWVFAFWPLGAEAQELLKYSDAQFMKALQNFFWVPSGPAQDKQVYVIVAPWCPDSKEFYIESLKHKEDIQFRYILFSPLNDEQRRRVTDAILTRSKKTLDAIYFDTPDSAPAGKHPERQGVGNFVLTVTDSFKQALPDLALRAKGLQPEYPTTIYLSKEGLKIIMGVRPVFDFFEKFSADVAATPENRGIASALTPFLERPPVVSGTERTKPLARSEGGATLYVAPSVSCPSVARLAKDTGLETWEETVADGQKWYLFRLPKGSTLYGRQEDFYTRWDRTNSGHDGRNSAGSVRLPIISTGPTTRED